VGLNRVEFDVFGELRRQVILRVDRMHRAYVDTGHAINAVFRVNDDLVFEFVEAGDGTDLYTVSKLASVTFIGDDVRHGIVRLGEKIAVTVSNNLAMPAWSILVSKSSLDHAQMMLTTRQAFYVSMRLNRSVFQHPLSRVAERRAIRSGLGAQYETHGQ